MKAEEQVVAGTLHHLTVEVIDAGKKKLYEAKVWVKPWMNFKELQEFKHVGDSSFTPSDLGAKRGNEPKPRCLVPVCRLELSTFISLDPPPILCIEFYCIFLLTDMCNAFCFGDIRTL